MIGTRFLNKITISLIFSCTCFLEAAESDNKCTKAVEECIMEVRKRGFEPFKDIMKYDEEIIKCYNNRPEDIEDCDDVYCKSIRTSLYVMDELPPGTLPYLNTICDKFGY